MLCWQRLTKSGKLTAMAKVGKYLATATGDTKVKLWAWKGRSAFEPLCQAIVTGQVTTLAIVDASELKLHPRLAEIWRDQTEFDSDSNSSVVFVNEKRLQDSYDSEVSPTGQQNNTASSGSVIFISEERLEFESDDEDDAEEDLTGDQQEDVSNNESNLNH